MRYIFALLVSAFFACAPAMAYPSPAAKARVGKLGFFQPRSPKTPVIELKAFDKQTVDGFVAKFRELDAAQSGDPAQKVPGEVWVRIHTYGGSVAGGEDIIHALEGAKSYVVCVADFRAMSMGFEVLQSAGCDFRLMTPRATLMTHEVQLTGVGGGPGDIADYLNYQKKLSDAGLKTSAKRMGVSEAFLREKTERKMWFIDAEEAEKYHAVDGFVDPAKVPAATPFEVKKSMLELLLGGD